MSPWEFLAWAVALGVSSIVVTIAIAVAIAVAQSAKTGVKKRKSIR